VIVTLEIVVGYSEFGEVALVIILLLCGIRAS